MNVYLTTTHPTPDTPDAPLFPNRRKGGAPDPRALDWSSPVEPGALYENAFKPALAAAGLPVSALAVSADDARTASSSPQFAGAACTTCVMASR